MILFAGPKQRLPYWLYILFLAHPFSFSYAQARLAIVNFQGEPEASEHLSKLASATNFQLLEKEPMQLALKGSGYNGSLNLSVDEARALGLSLGCDFYVLGKAQILRRLVSEKEFYFDVYVAGFLIETQTGKLLRFAFEKTQTQKENATRKQLLDLTEKIWLQFADALKSPPQLVEKKIAIDVYDLDSVEAARLKIKAPQFFRRIKPAYTETAGFANINATVEVKVIFRADGQIGAAEIMRWAGFGLDESAIATVWQLRFDPARINEQAVSISAIVRYNFGKEEKAK